MKKALFIDRDGTLVVEPPVDFQVDSLEKLEYLPGVFRNLYFIRQQLDYELIMVSNQDGMGRPQYPEEIFNLVQDKILTAFKNEGILFDRIHIDSSLPEDDLPSRKPGTAMLTVYMEGDYDLANSFVIGDRLTDIELARNLGAKAILIGGQDRQQEIDEAGLAPHCSYIAGDWSAVYVYLLRNRRRAQIVRETTETRIRIDLSLDGTNRHNISTGIGFFDHMLEQIARHGGVDLEVEVTGDLHVAWVKLSPKHWVTAGELKDMGFYYPWMNPRQRCPWTWEEGALWSGKQHSAGRRSATCPRRCLSISSSLSVIRQNVTSILKSTGKMNITRPKLYSRPLPRSFSRQ